MVYYYTKIFLILFLHHIYIYIYMNKLINTFYGQIHEFLKMWYTFINSFELKDPDNVTKI